MEGYINNGLITSIKGVAHEKKIFLKKPECSSGI